MKIVILGASGRTGKVLLEQALKRGHQVTAVVRNPQDVTSTDNLRTVKADVTNEQDLAKVFKGQDAILSTLGNNNASLKLIERSIRAVVPAMRQNGVKRFITELSFGASKSIRFAPVAKRIISLSIGKMLVDQAVGVELLKQSGLDWTVVFAVRLTDGPVTKQVRVLKDKERVSLRNTVSRNDTAYFMLEALENSSFIGQEPVIAHR